MSSRWSRPTREQYRAWYAVKKAIQRGIMVRPETCERCGRSPGLNRRGRSLLEAHHFRGYDRDHHLDVQFLCPPCHKQADQELERRPIRAEAAGLVERLRQAKERRDHQSTDFRG